MFVIVQSLDNLEVRPGENIEERVSRALKHAGVSVTVTSVTDVFAFAVGAVTVQFVHNKLFLNI